MGLCTWMTPQKCLKPMKLFNLDPLWAWQNLWGYGKMILTSFWPWGMPWDPSYDHFCVQCRHPTCKSLLMKVLQLGRMAISGGWFLVFYYCISYEKSESGYTCSGGWTFCKFVDFSIIYEVRLSCIWVAFEVRLSCVLLASEVHLRRVTSPVSPSSSSRH